MQRPLQSPILLAGPTASGKSAVALRIAKAIGGLIINADSMQVYRDLRLLSARPTPDDEASVPHRLYGHVTAAEAYSVGRYVVDVEHALDEARARDLCPIFVGGTGLYFKALLEGLSPIPQIDAAIREHWRTEAQNSGAPALHEILRRRDPETAQRLAAGDTQRITRALEVLDSSGRSISEWQRQKGRALLTGITTRRLVMRPEKETLWQRCDARFDAMIDQGALDEVRALLQAKLDPALPVMGALGVAPLAAYLAGEVSLEDAVTQAKLDTRHYVKRQITWLKRNMISWTTVQNCDSDCNDRSIKHIVESYPLFD